MRVPMILVVVAVATAFVAGPAFADSITYELVVHVAGQVEGSKPVGTITFADGSVGDNSYDIATAGTEFDLGVADYPSSIPGWRSGDTGISANGTVRFASGVIGDAVLIPYQHPVVRALGELERWSFRYDAVPLVGAPTGPPDLVLQLYADSFSSGWGWQDFSPVTVYDSTSSFLAADIIEWELRAVPEPGSLFLSGLALTGALFWRRRSRAA